MPVGVLYPEDSSAKEAGEQVLLPVRCPDEEAGTCVLPGSNTRLAGGGANQRKPANCYSPNI